MSDQCLFGFNRFGGIDRLEGGSRPPWLCTLRGIWGGRSSMGWLASLSSHDTYSAAEVSGLRDNVFDIVGHLSFTPTSWFDTTFRFRFDHRSGELRIDVTALAGKRTVRVTAGFSIPVSIHITIIPRQPDFFSQPSTCRVAFLYAAHEITLGASSPRANIASPASPGETWRLIKWWRLAAMRPMRTSG